MIWLKQSTTADAILGPFIDDTDFKTAKTALTIAQADIRLSKNGGAFAQTNNVAGATHRENGNYLIPLDTTDTNTLGRLRVVVNEATALQVWQDFMVVPANVWDSLFGADKLQIDVAEWLGTAAATPTVAGVPEVDVTHVGGTLQTAGDIMADTNDIQSRLPAALDTGRMIAKAEVVTDKTGYAIGIAGIGVGAIDANVITAATLAADATPRILKNTALSNFPFLMVDSVDHVTPETGIVFAAGDSQVSIDGAAFVNTTNLPVEIGAGMYKINLVAADMNGDTIILKFSKTGADTRLITVVTQP